MIKEALKSPTGTMLRTVPSPSEPLFQWMHRVEVAANNRCACVRAHDARVCCLSNTPALGGLGRELGR